MRQNWIEFLLRLPVLFLGFFLLAIGIVANLYSNLGTSPWGVLHVGLSNVTPLTLGQATQLVGLLIVLFSWILGFAPGLGTLANMVFIGFFVDLVIAWGLVPLQTELPWQLTQLVVSIGIIGAGVFLYLRVQLGAGPRDGLMMGLVKKLDKSVSIVRAPMEVVVCIIGYFLGGPVGIGTVITALSIGYSIQFFFKIGRFDSKSEQFDLPKLYEFLTKGKKK